MDVLETPDLTARLEEARRRAVPAGELSALVLRHGSMELRMYQPGDPGDQTPHDRDELYLIAAGTAVLLRGTPASPWQEEPLIGDALERIPLRAGDAAVVPAGTPHRFVETSPGFAAWLVFWGPEGGESA